MEVFEAIADVRASRWADAHLSWGLVPTMGFLHEGHLSLVHRARRENDRVGVSIFVNPAQFNNPGDLEAYPSNTDRDLDLLREAGADLVWMPSREVVYPPGYQTYVEVEALTQPLEGAHRAGHFRGVTTVVCKLFNVFAPRRAYFGQKDAQQALTIRRMVEDLNFNLEIVVCETVRDRDGLALSSRNVRLSPAARSQSTCLNRALHAARAAFSAGQRDADCLREAMQREIATAPLARLEYASVADPETLAELERVDGRALLSLAVELDGVRLIDNLQLGASP